MEFWRAEADGWIAQCVGYEADHRSALTQAGSAESGSDKAESVEGRSDRAGSTKSKAVEGHPVKPVPVKVKRNGEIVIGNAPPLSPLSWSYGDERLDMTKVELDLVHVEHKTLETYEPGETLILHFLGPVWEVKLHVSCFPELEVIRVGGSLGSVVPLNAAVHDVRWDFASPVEEPPIGRLPMRAYTIQGVRLEDQYGFPVSFLECFENLWAGHPRSWTADQTDSGKRSGSSNAWLPWLAVMDGAGNGSVLGIEWSGIWTTSVQWNPATDDRAGYVHLQAGSDFSIVLTEGTQIELPSAFVGLVFRDGLDQAADQIHRYVRHVLMPPLPDENFPWVQFNSWYPWTANLYESDMEAQLDRAAELGTEVFVLDDGWFRGWDERAGWGSGAGWWIADDEKFPSGIRNFGDKVRARGMKFGLWIEPERVDTRVIGETGIEEHWLAGSSDNVPYPPDATSAGQQPCFGCPETVEWAKAQLDRLIVEYGADWIKWDHNRYKVCHRSDHGHQEGDGNRAHTLGVYEVMNYVRKRYPHVVLENCASGGSRLDYGIVQHTHLNWLSDYPSPSYRARSQFAGAVLAFPPELHNAWVIPDSGEPLTESNARYKMRSCMLGTLGISYPLPQLSPEVLQILTEEIASYKKLRPLIRSARCRRLLPQETNLASWGAFGYLPPRYACKSTPKKEDDPIGAILVFRGPQSTVSQQTIQVPGLRHDTVYTLRDPVLGTVTTLSGTELEEQGLTVALSEMSSSSLIWIYK